MGNLTKLSKNAGLIEKILLVIIILLMVYLLYLQVRKNDGFQAKKKKKCPWEPLGFNELNKPKGGENDGPEYENGKIKTCGKLIKKGTARCSGEGSAFECF